MTREQTIEKLKTLYTNAVAAMLRADACGDDESSKVMTKYAETLNAAINALETALQTDGDCISRQAAIDAPEAQERQCATQKRRYTFGNDEFSLEAAYHDCKLVFDGITDDDSFQEADTGLILYYANEIIYALHKALEGKDINVPINDCISRQAAIDAVETKIKKWNAVDGEGYHVGLGLRYTDVIDTLTDLPSVLPEPCEDAISRADAIRVASGYCHPANVAQELAKLPSVQPDNSCDGCKYEDVDDGVLVPCGFCKRGHPDNYERRTDETD